jgi:putative transposase
MCQRLEVSRSAYHQWVKRGLSQRAQQDVLIVNQIKVIHEEYRQTYGRRRLYHALKARGILTAQSRIARLMKENHLYAHDRRRWRPKTKAIKHGLDNHLKNIPLTQPNQAWTTDITYLKTQQGWLYLAAVMDQYTRQIVGWAMDTRMHSSLVERALIMALQRRRPENSVIVHSDRGSQYMSMDYQQLLRKLGFIASASQTGNCYDNATMESFWHSLKVECLYRDKIQSIEQTRSKVFDYIEGFYNSKRAHSALGYLSPNQFNHSSFQPSA